MPGRFTMEAIFLLRCLMEKYQVVSKNLHLVFVDLERSHYRLPKEVMWWVLGSPLIFAFAYDIVLAD